MKNFKSLREKTLTPAELKKREEIAKAMERENPGMPMAKKMAIATAAAKKVAESVELDEAEMSLYDKIKAARKNPSPDKSVRGRGSKNRNPKTYDVRNKLDKEDDRYQDLIKKRLKKNEEVELDEISLSHLSNAIAKSTGTKNVKTAMKPGEVKKGLDDLKKRLATLGQEPKMAKEAYEEEPASPDEKSMAMRQAKFIQYVGDEIMEHLEQDGDFPEWMQNKLSELHQKAKDMHSTMAGSYEDDEEEMDEAVQSADKKPEKFVKPDGKVGIRMVRVDKKVVDKDA